MKIDRILKCVAFAAGCVATAACFSAPVITAWPSTGAASGVAAAPIAGHYATSDTTTDTVELRDIRGVITHSVTRAQIAALLPWMSLGSGPDGPGTLAFSDSGRLLFILVHDATAAGDGQPSDAILRFDTFDGTLGVFSRLEISASEIDPPRAPVAFFKGRLYVGAETSVRIFRASRTDLTGPLLSTTTLPDAGAARCITVDRDNSLVIAGSGANIYRSGTVAIPPVWATIGAIPSMRAGAFSDQFGASGSDGLFVLADGASFGQSRLWRIPTNQVRGQASFSPVVYADIAEDWTVLGATADGALLGASGLGARRLTDSADTRLGFEAWVLDEFRQVVSFARNLIDPDGEPTGWVIDADVQQGWSRFHPATPDGACWTILALIVSDAIDNDAAAQGRIRDILVRYSGLAADSIKPSTTADGIMRHWIYPVNGSNEPGWSTEFAIYSQMKLCLGAERAMAAYPDDGVIQQAGAAIMCQVKNWANYIQPGTDAVYLTANVAGGPFADPRNFPFTEGIHFVEQASVFGTAAADAPWSRWINRALWPTATYLTGRPLTTSGANSHHPAFITLYSFLAQAAFRNSPAWRIQVDNLLASSSAWTDDSGPRYFTVFSAGTTPSGYNADTFGNHPDNLTSFPALMAFAGSGDTSPAASAYHAYRRGARQTFALGDSILFRRSDIDRNYSPNSAGLPDVVLGALGLAELLQPGVIDSLLAREYSPYACPPDVSGDGAATIEDLYLWHAAPTDLDRDGTVGAADAVYLLNYLRQREANDF